MTPIDAVATHAVGHANGKALIDLETDRTWTYAELNAAVDRAAAWLAEELGPASGERVATLSKNCAEMLILQLACARAGSIFVPLNWRLSAGEIEALTVEADPAILFLGDDFAAPDGPRRCLKISQIVELGHPGHAAPAEARRDFSEVNTLLFTSGTSGQPKGVMLSEKNIFWGCSNFLFGSDVSMHSVFLCDMPLFHTAGLLAAARVPLLAGGCVLISAGFDAPKTLARLTDPQLGVTHYFSVPQMAAWIWEQPGFDPQKLSSLACWAIGGAPHPASNASRFIDADIPIADGFGMSEVCSAFGMPPHNRRALKEKVGSCGPAFMSIEARIVDDQGVPLAPDQVGELWLRGPSVTQGYWNQPDATEAAFTNGWFRTGDSARIDEDGYLFVVDRKKDMFISGGENVYPAEVEAAIAELPEVAEVAVIGIADERWGEVGRAYVVPASGCEVSIEMIADHCAGRLAKYKIPKSVKCTDALPRTASGKIQKHLLRAQAGDG